MSFSAQIATSLFLAAAVVAAPTASTSVGYGSVSFARNGVSGHPTWQPDYSAADGNYEDYAQLVRRGEYGVAQASPSRRAVQKAHQPSSDTSSSSSSGEDNGSDDDYHHKKQAYLRPAFSRELPTPAQIQYEQAQLKQRQGARLQRRSYDSDSDYSSESDSYGQEYRRALRRTDGGDYRRLVRRSGRGGRHRGRHNTYSDDTSSESDSAAYHPGGNDNDYRPSKPNHTPYADDYYNGIATKQRDYRLVRRGDYVKDETPSRRAQRAARRAARRSGRRSNDTDTSASDTSSGSSSENHGTEDDSDDGGYGSDDYSKDNGYDSDDTKHTGNDYKSAQSYTAPESNEYKSADTQYQEKEDY